MKQLLNLLLFFCWLSIQLSANAAELKIAFATDRPPYCFRADNLDRGIEIDLLRQIMGLSGHTVKVITMPKVRLIKAVKEKEVDAAATVQDNLDPTVYFSDPYLEFQNVVISKSKHAIEVKSLQDLSRFTFVIWQDGWKNLGPGFEANYRPDANGNFPKNYHQAFNQLSQNKMFWADRVQLIIIDKTIFQHHQRLLAKELNTSEPLTYHDLIKTKTSYSVVFQQPQLRHQFNEGLKKLRANGIYQKTIDHYK